MSKSQDSKAYRLGVNFLFILLLSLNLRCTFGGKSTVNDDKTFRLGDGSLPLLSGYNSGATSLGSSGTTNIASNGLDLTGTQDQKNAALQRYLDYLKTIINPNGFYNLNPQGFPSSIQDLIQHNLCSAYNIWPLSENAYRFTAALGMDVFLRALTPDEIANYSQSYPMTQPGDRKSVV